MDKEYNTQELREIKKKIAKLQRPPSADERRLKQINEKRERRKVWIYKVILNNDIEWDWFATLTFRDSKSTYSAKRYFNRWLRKLNRRIFGGKAKYQDVSIPWVLAEERQDRGAIHYHVLLGFTDSLMRNEWGKKWWELTGGYGKIDRTRLKGAVYYVTKYIMKDGDLDVDIRTQSGQRLTLDDPAIATQAEAGRVEALTGVPLPADAN